MEDWLLSTLVCAASRLELSIWVATIKQFQVNTYKESVSLHFDDLNLKRNGRRNRFWLFLSDSLRFFGVCRGFFFVLFDCLSRRILYFFFFCFEQLWMNKKKSDSGWRLDMNGETMTTVIGRMLFFFLTKTNDRHDDGVMRAVFRSLWPKIWTGLSIVPDQSRVQPSVSPTMNLWCGEHLRCLRLSLIDCGRIAGTFV